MQGEGVSSGESSLRLSGWTYVKRTDHAIDDRGDSTGCTMRLCHVSAWHARLWLFDKTTSWRSGGGSDQVLWDYTIRIVPYTWQLRTANMVTGWQHCFHIMCQGGVKKTMRVPMWFDIHSFTHPFVHAVWKKWQYHAEPGRRGGALRTHSLRQPLTKMHAATEMLVILFCSRYVYLPPIPITENADWLVQGMQHRHNTNETAPTLAAHISCSQCTASVRNRPQEDLIKSRRGRKNISVWHERC